MRRTHRLRATLAVAVLSGVLMSSLALPGLTAPRERAVGAAPCTSTKPARPAAAKARPAGMPGGDWGTYGADLHGTQHQKAEKTIGVGNVATLERVWTTGDTGYQSPAPIVSGGCVFINTEGHIDALDLETGERVWRSKGADTSGTFAVMVVGGRVHVGLNNGGKPKAAAFDVTDGHLLWQSKEIWFGYETTQQASAIVHDGIQVLFTTGPDFDPEARQGYGLIDARTGKVLYASTTIPQKDLEAGYAGGGVWGTPTVDPVTDYLYVGTSNPESKTREHAYDNAILKLDLDRRRPTFGRIVGSFKGTPDSATGYDNPACQTAGETAWTDGGIYGSSPTCGQLDVDFGSGPTLWRDARGRLLGAATQKSGWLHVFDARTMKRVWDRQLFVTTSFLGGNFGRIATDGETLYVAANPGILHALDADDGTERWQASFTGLPMKGGNVALANGVVYYVDEPALKAWDAETGELLWMSSPAPSASIGSGVAIAGHHVVANHYGTISAYRLSGTAGGGPTTAPTPAPPARSRPRGAKPHYLVFTATYGFRHDGIQEAVAEIQRQAAETGAFTVEVTDDAAALGPRTYGRVDGVILVNTTGLGSDASPLTDRQKSDFIDFFDCGAGLVGIHAAADSGGGWPEFDALLGSTGFDFHPHLSLEARDNPAGREAFNPALLTDVNIQIEDPNHVTTRPWRGFDSFRITDEIYRYSGDPRADKRLRVVLSLDEESHYWRSELGLGPAAGGLAPTIANPVSNPVNLVPPLAFPDDNPVAWVKTYGVKNGRVFYTNLGHNMATWERSDFRGHLLAGIGWVSRQRPNRTCTATRFAS